MTQQTTTTMYSVWVGAVEVNRTYIDTLTKAKDLATYWREEGYTDVVVEEIQCGVETESELPT